MRMFIDFKEEEGRGRGRGRERERERQRNIDVREKHQSVASRTHPNWGLNPQRFGAQDDAPTN